MTAIATVPRNQDLRLIPHSVHLLRHHVPKYEPTYCSLISKNEFLKTKLRFR